MLANWRNSFRKYSEDLFIEPQPRRKKEWFQAGVDPLWLDNGELLYKLLPWEIELPKLKSNNLQIHKRPLLAKDP